MNYYEKIFILDPNIDDSAVEEITVRIKETGAAANWLTS